LQAGGRENPFLGPSVANRIVTVTKNPHVGVVLDFDGTLVQSMELHARAYREALAPFGVTITDEEIFAREGARSESIIREFLGKVGKDDPTTIKRVSDGKQATYRSFGPPALYPGAREFVRALRRDVGKLGLVTGTRRENLDRLIPDLVPLFDALLAQESYTHDKPHPEPYAKTAAALGLAPARCAALENAPRGVQSARAAGYGFVVGVSTTVPGPALTTAGADVVVGTLEAAEAAILSWASKLSARPSG
jgi:beta-phosphoglucomutase